jgi:uncharacterized membrane protein YdcZ (DUF606 family)
VPSSYAVQERNAYAAAWIAPLAFAIALVNLPDVDEDLERAARTRAARQAFAWQMLAGVVGLVVLAFPRLVVPKHGLGLRRR